MQIHLPSEYDERLAIEMVEVLDAARLADAPHQPPAHAASHLGYLRHGWDGHGPDRVITRRDPNGRLVGFAEVEISHWEDNQDLAWIELTVHPELRRRGHGSALLDAAEEVAASLGKRLLMGATWEGSPAGAFPAGRGYADGQHEAERRLDLTTLDWSGIAKLHDEAAEKAAGYELLRVVGPAPEEMLADLVDVTAAINDAPLDDLEFEDEVYSAERLRSFDQAQAARQRTVYRLLARRVSDGAWAGHTLVAVDRYLPTWGDQLDTSVVVSHRGHQLGLLLKTAMLRWLRDAEPQLEQIDTWNAQSNAHMIAVNDLIGCRVVGGSAVWQRRV